MFLSPAAGLHDNGFLPGPSHLIPVLIFPSKQWYTKQCGNCTIGHSDEKRELYIQELNYDNLRFIQRNFISPVSKYSLS